MTASEGVRSLADLLRRHAQQRPEALAYTFLEDGEEEGARLSWGELHLRARALGARLQEGGLAGARILLLYPPGLDFVVALLGCWYGGAVAVPAYPPRPGRPQPRLASLAEDSRPQAVLTVERFLRRREALRAHLPSLDLLPWIASDRLEPPSDGTGDGDGGASPGVILEAWARRWAPTGAQEELSATGSFGGGTALIQYTSGSTASPRGVRITHANLLANERLITAAFAVDENSVIVSWLPLYHDMGLIGGVLQPLATGAHCVLMSPFAFLRRPQRWLEAISRYRGTVSGGPNFAFDHCARKIPQEALEGLDLSSWRVAFNGSEPVRVETLRRFSKRFSSAGFSSAAFYPCYGLAEATLFVTGGKVGEGPMVISTDAEGLEVRRRLEAASRGRPARRLVACGSPGVDHELLIVDPQLRRPVPAGMEGEIWLRGPSVARGYWHRPAETEQLFLARLAPQEGAAGAPPSGAYLRTGDLGCQVDGRLYVTGRSKDLIILRGRNLYPQDAEAAARDAHSAIVTGGAAAFGVDVEGEERLVLVVELERRREQESEDAAAAVANALLDQLQAAPWEVVTVSAGTLPRTSSGKVQRARCGQLYRRGELAKLEAAGSPVAGSPVAGSSDKPAPGVAASGQDSTPPGSASDAALPAATEAREEGSGPHFAVPSIPSAPAGVADSSGAAVDTPSAPAPSAAGAAEGPGHRSSESAERPAGEAGGASEVDEAVGEELSEVRRALARVLDVAPSAVEPGRRLGALGLDSLAAVELQQALESAGLGVPPVEDLLDNPTVAELASAVARAASVSSRGSAEGSGRAGGAPAQQLQQGPEEGPARLSPQQEGLWFLQRLAPRTAAYHLSAAVRVVGPLDQEALQVALARVVSRHPGLATVFPEVEGVPHQRPVPEWVPNLHRIDASGWSEERLRRSLRRAAWAPFDLENRPPLRLTVLSCPPGEHYLVFAVHHLVADLWSLGTVLRELAIYYRLGEVDPSSTAAARLMPPPPPPTLSALQWSRAQRRFAESAAGEALIQRWRQRLEGTARPQLPLDRPRPAKRAFRGGGVALHLAEDLTAALEALRARQEQEQGSPLSWFPWITAAFVALLMRYGGQRHLRIGVPTSGRATVPPELGPQAQPGQLARLVAYCVSPVPLRADLGAAGSSGPAFLDLVRSVAAEASEAQALQHVAAARLLPKAGGDDGGQRLGAGAEDLFGAMVVWQRPRRGAEALAPLALDLAGEEVDVAGWRWSTVALDPPGAQTDLALHGALMAPPRGDSPHRLELQLRYDAEIFDRGTAERMVGHLRSLLEGVLADPHTPVADLPLLSLSETFQLLEEWSGSSSLYQGPGPARPVDEDLYPLFAAQVERVPELPAVITASGQASYRRLARRVWAVAKALQDRGIGPGDRVAVMLPRSAELPAALLAVVAVGAAYVPLDPAYPLERTALMLEDGDARCVLTKRALLPLLPLRGDGTPPDFVALDSLQDADQPPPLPKVDEGRLAYILYTSGSTGRPKGVAVTRRGLRELLRWARRVFPERDRAGVLASTSVCFDLSVFELFLPLTSGGAAVVVRDALALAEPGPWRERVTLINTVPSAIAELLRFEALPPTLNTVNLAGEALKGELAKRVLEQPGVGRLLNLYGPSEDTTYSTFSAVKLERLESGREPGIGRPVAGGRAYVLDERGQLAPPGVAGELYLGGSGLARGYWRRPGRTAESFLPHPFSQQPGERLYRTGDRVRFDESGALEFLGRLDQQVKIRGFRVELGEVEARLVACAGVEEAAVLVREVAGESRLVAYAEAEEGSASSPSPSLESIRDELALHLPAPFLPSALEVLDRLPRTPNGKIDRRALRLRPVVIVAAAAQEESPRSPLEAWVAEAFAEVLGVAGEISRSGDFFTLGGHSLAAARLAALGRRDLGVDPPLDLVFRHPTVSDFSAALEHAGARLRGAEGSAETAAPEAASTVSDAAPSDFAASDFAASDFIAPKPLGASGPRPGSDALDETQEEGPRPLSFPQEGLWFLDRLEPQGLRYAMPAVVLLQGPLEVADLAAAFSSVVQRQESLRTTVGDVDGVPYQRIAAPPRGRLGLPLVDLSRLEGSLPAGSAAELALTLVRRHGRRAFDLENGPLWRAALVRTAAGEHWLSVSLHHIIADGASLGVLVRELEVAYRRSAEARRGDAEETPVLPPLAVQPSALARAQRRALTASRRQQLESYWLRRLDGVPSVVELPSDHPRRPRRRYRGETVAAGLDVPTTAAVLALARRHGTSLFAVTLATYGLLVARLAQQREVVVGVPASRRETAAEGLIGLFVNTLAIPVGRGVRRSEEDGEGLTFSALLRDLGPALARDLAHRDLPFEALVEALDPPRDPSRTPLVQVMLALQDTPLDPPRWPGVSARRLPADAGFARCDFTLLLERQRVAGAADEAESFVLGGAAEYDLDLFERTTVERWMESWRQLVTAAVADPQRRVDGLPLLSAAQQGQLLERGRGADLSADLVPQEYAEGLPGLVRAQAQRSPREVAVATARNALSYRQLAARMATLRLAVLRSVGVTAGDLAERRVAVMLPREPELVVALLAVMEAGGAYVPLDPNHPPRRLAAVLEDSGAVLVLTLGELLKHLPDSPAVPVLTLEEVASEVPTEAPIGAPIEAGNAAAPSPLDPPALDSRRLAYVLFTSGSTGRPKGVAVTHGSAVALLRWAASTFPRPWLRSVLASTHVGFDLSVFELFLPLALGGRVILAADALELAEHPLGREVTLLNTVPSAAAEVLRLEALPPSVRGVLLAGEPLRRQLAEELLARPGVESVYNLYGPSEDTTYSTAQRVTQGAPGAPAIGHAVAGSEAHVVDSRLQLLPRGVPGELVLGGAGLARGYLQRPALTAAAFVPHPFGRGERLYRTGDRVGRRSDGTLEFLGRFDHQVKVRGFRIELGEIEGALESLPGIAEAAVVVQRVEKGEGDSLAADRRLVAWVGTAGTALGEASGIDTDTSIAAPAAQVAQWRQGLEQLLPPSAIPSVIHPVEALPRNASGKIDRPSLARWVPRDLESEAVGRLPGSPTEELVAEIWREVLALPVDAPLGAEHNFFALGGHSLLATRVLAQIRQRRGVELPLRTLFEAPTLEALARVVDGRQMAPAPQRASLRSAAAPEGPLSFAQERLWFLQQLADDLRAYHLAGGLELRGPLEVATLARAVVELVERHDSLRTIFPTTISSTMGREGEAPVPRQRVTPAVAEAATALAVIDLSALPAELGEELGGRLLNRAAARPMPMPVADPSVADPSVEASSLEEGLAPRAGEPTPLLRAVLLRRGPRRHLFGLTVHHIAADGSSTALLWRDLAAAYGGRSSPPPATSYRDFARWQRERLEGDRRQDLVEGWGRLLEGTPEVLELPTDRPRPAMASYLGRLRREGVSARLPEALGAVAERQGASRFLALLAAFAVLVGRWSGAQRFLLGVPSAQREAAELAEVVGLFVNTLAVPVDLRQGPTFQQLLELLQRSFLEAHDLGELPFEELVEARTTTRDPSRPPLVQVLFSLLEIGDGAAAAQLPGIESRPLSVDPGGAKMDLFVSLIDHPALPEAQVEYATDLFDEATVERFMTSFRTLATAAAQSPELPVAALPLLTTAEAEQISSHWNRSAAPAEEGSVHGAILHRAGQLGEAEALCWVGEDGEDRALSYAALERRSAALGRSLVALGAAPGSLVALALPRGVELVVAMLAVLRSGAAYLPLDPAYPAERLRQMLQDSGAELLLLSGRAQVTEDEVAEDEGAGDQGPQGAQGQKTESHGAATDGDNTYAALNLSAVGAELSASEWISRSMPGSSVARAENAGGVKPVTLDLQTEGEGSSESWSPAADPLPTAVDPGHLAYVLYTSGSTGRPKGVEISHRSVLGFFAGMDRVIGSASWDSSDPRDPRDSRATWLATTSVSFDISVLELLWTLARGFRVVLRRGPVLGAAASESGVAVVGDSALAAPSLAASGAAAVGQTATGPCPQLGLMYFAASAHGDNGDGGEVRGRYDLLLEGARFADRRGLASVWTPERHFHAFGGLYPNPSVTGAAVAAVTERVAVRAGSVVLPLHHPVRVAEEWSLVDNLSGGRVGVSFASGWHPDDFALAPDAFESRHQRLREDLETVRALWRGESVTLTSGSGRPTTLSILPRPRQPELPVWITAAGSVETFRFAAEAGAGVLTHLLGQSLEELLEKIAAYRQAWSPAPMGNGSSPGGSSDGGHVTLMLHAYVLPDGEQARAVARGPLKEYLRSSAGLLRRLASAAGMSEGEDLTAEDEEAVLEHAVDRYLATSGLVGSPRELLPRLRELAAAGVDEVACLVDFGIADAAVAAAFETLGDLSDLAQEASRGAAETSTEAVPFALPPGGSPSVPELSLPKTSVPEPAVAEMIRRFAVTHLQLTPSTAAALLREEEMEAVLPQLRLLALGGEALPPSLAEEVRRTAPGTRLVNLYGPTEATVWASAREVAEGSEAPGVAAVSLGEPLTNVRLYIVDESFRPVPPGVVGELVVAGIGLARGYRRRPALTAERFVPDPFTAVPGAGAGERLYRTGDRARRRADGRLDFLGRADGQLKVRGFRVEPGEIEAVLRSHPAVEQAAVIARGDGVERRLAAFVTPAQRDSRDAAAGQRALEAPAISAQRRQELLAGRDVYRVRPYGPGDSAETLGVLEAACLGEQQASLLEREIFHEARYLRGGLTLRDGDVVVDAGSNVGFFVLWAFCQRRELQVHAFEPIPETYEVLSTNIALHGLGDQVRAHPHGLAREEEQATLTFYPHMAGLSGRGAHPETAREVSRSLILDGLQRRGLELPQQEIEAMLDRSFVSEPRRCPLRPLGRVLEELELDRIDLLKVDVEGAELEVLAGLGQERWGTVRQVALEIDTAEDTARARMLLEEKGFEVTVEPFLVAPAVEVSMVYGLRPEWRRPTPGEGGPPPDGLLPRLDTGALAAELRRRATEALPAYMVPATVSVLAELPRTPNGKLDRRALADLEAPATTAARKPAESELEQRLAGLWQQVLGLAREPGVNESFFELGGTSLSVVELRRRLEEDLELKVPVVELFRHPSIAALASFLESGAGEEEGRAESGRERGRRARQQARSAQASAAEAARRARSRRRRPTGEAGEEGS
ncbi:MAG: amino acid adenylation domain-containing protein [Acidobacteriota bacterium]